MPIQQRTDFGCKLIPLMITMIFLAGCSTNEATGRQQFTPLLSKSQEAQLGASEHQNILNEFGGEYQNRAVQNYVERVGQSLVPHTERNDVRYTFTVLDSPVVNAMALPGGYVYISRGLLAIMGDEAQLAAVLGHEMGHVTARHTAERMTQSTVAGLGGVLLGAVLENPSAARAAGLGANLYLASYSRSQENEADQLGIRYIDRANYDAYAMAEMMKRMQIDSQLQEIESGRSGGSALDHYFSTHPQTAERVQKTTALAKTASDGKSLSEMGRVNSAEFLAVIDGMTYGSSSKQGFVDGGYFVHPEIGFKFMVPDGYRVINEQNAVFLQSKTNSNVVAVFDMAEKQANMDLSAWLKAEVLKEEGAAFTGTETTSVNGMPAAVTQYKVGVNGNTMHATVMAIEWMPGQISRFQVLMPVNTPASYVETMKRLTYSFDRLSASERNSFRPKTIDVFTAKQGDTVASVSASMPFKDDLNRMRFRALNGLTNDGALVPGQPYKTVSQ